MATGKQRLTNSKARREALCTLGELIESLDMPDNTRLTLRSIFVAYTLAAKQHVVLTTLSAIRGNYSDLLAQVQVVFMQQLADDPDGFLAVIINESNDRQADTEQEREEA